MKKILLMASVALLPGCSYIHSTPDEPKILHYTCGTMPLTVTVDNSRQDVQLILDGNPLTLKQLEAASGTRYGDGKYVFMSKGDGAVIERNNKIIINDCRLNGG